MAFRTLRCGIFFVALAFSGCAVIEPEPDPIPEPIPVPAEPLPEIVEPPPVVEPIPAVKPPEPPQLPTVAIVITNSQPAYTDIADELARRFDHYEIYDLSDDSRPPVSVLRRINDSDSSAVVAIGLRAATSSVAMSEKPVVFSQVFNFQDHDLLQKSSRGVASIAPLDAQIAAWKEFDPAISTVGAIVGPGHDGLIEEASLAAEQHGIELIVQVTHSDQETLYFFKRMIRDIDGFWLFPDNRVLSRRALQEIMADAQQLQVPVMVPSESMLQIGASISASSVASDIAATITRIVQQIQAGRLLQVPPMSALSEIRIKTSGAARVVDQ